MVQALSRWGTRWIGDLGDVDLDPHLLLWDMRRTISVDAWPRSRTMVEFGFGDITGKAARWWLVVDADTVEVCDFDPGYDLTARVDTDLRTLTEIWRGDIDWATALHTDRMTILADPSVRRNCRGGSVRAHRRQRRGRMPRSRDSALSRQLQQLHPRSYQRVT